MYLEANKASKALGVSSTTLRRWHKSGKIKAIRTPTNRRLYEVSTILNQKNCLNSSITVSSIAEEVKQSYIYARVSSNKQKLDLDRHIQLLQSYYPTHSVLHDIGSGINFKRPKFKTLLERASPVRWQIDLVLHVISGQKS